MYSQSIIFDYHTSNLHLVFIQVAGKKCGLKDPHRGQEFQFTSITVCWAFQVIKYTQVKFLEILY